MKIGIVLSRPPVYSESFLNFKISGLIKNGFEVELFVNDADPNFSLCTQYVLPRNNIESVLSLIKTLFIHPARLIKLIGKEISDDKSLKIIIKNVYLNLHLLNSSNLDWVHFSFMTTTVGREHIASVLNAKMGASIRGYDISRYPINHPSVYRDTWRKLHKLHYLSEALLNKAYKEGLEHTPEIPCIKITPAINAESFTGNGLKGQFKKPLRILTIARLHWVKGLDHTLQALYYLHQTGIDFKYTVIGDGTELERLQYTCYFYGISNKVDFIGKVAHDKIKQHYENNDIYLQYSIQEGFCNAVLEAQAMGLPCIVSDAEGLPENIINNTTGWVVPMCKPHLLTQKISEVSKTDKEELQLLCKNAQQRIKSKFNIHDQESKFVKFFSE